VRRIVLTCTALCFAAAASTGFVSCSSGSSGSKASTTTVFAGGTAPGGGTFGPTTTFMATCQDQPTAAVIGAAAGLPVVDGVVSGSGTCNYLGLNDQTKSILLSKFTTDADKANFLDLQNSLGTAAPVADASLPNAFVSPDFTVYTTVGDAIYTVKSTITTGGAEDVKASEAVLAAWLKG
jgi:hypothetical protein